MRKISDIKHAVYINLETRPDRKQKVELELKSVGINHFQRFNAIRLPNGAIGCSMSHLKCLENAKKNNLPYVLVVEDDIQFLNPEIFKNQMNKFLKEHTEWDVVLFAGNVVPPYINVDDTCIKVIKCQTTTGYLVKSHYYDTLIENFRTGIQNLITTPEDHRIYAIDKHWFKLQEKDNWYLITPLTVTQREDYSDIEKRHTNYTNVMLDMEKKWFFPPL